MSISGCTSCQAGQTQGVEAYRRLAQAPRPAEAPVLASAIQLGVNQPLPGESTGSILNISA